MPAETIRDAIRSTHARDWSRHGEHPTASMSMAETPNLRACQRRTLAACVP